MWTLFKTVKLWILFVCLVGILLKRNVSKVFSTVEPHYNEDLGTMKITLLNQVSWYIRVKKQKIYIELGPTNLPCYKKVLLYLTSL